MDEDVIGKDADISSHVAKLVDQCEDLLSEQSKERERALEYYNGEMKDLPADKGRSQIVSKDVRASIKKLMPSIMRSILSNDRIVDYDPVGEDDVEASKQATDYVNHVVVPECGAERALHDAIFDALVLKTGILKWSAYTMRKSVVHEYTNQSDDDVLGIVDDPDNELIDYETSEETDPDVLALDPNARRHSFKIRRIDESVDVKLEAVPRGSFLIFPGSENIEGSPIVGERLEVSRSDLVSMGYDKEDVYAIATSSSKNDDDDASRQGEDWTDAARDTSKALEIVTIYEVYVKLDRDDDGIAEMYKVVYGAEKTKDGGSESYIVLHDEPVAASPYAEVVCEREAHQFEGHSIFEDVVDVQRVKTALLRATLDNISWQNNPQPAVDLSQVEDPETIYNPQFGEPILLKQGADVSRAVQWSQVPFVAGESFNMLSYFDEVAKDRTGITDASGGVDPEQFQNMTATSAQLMSESGIAQAEMIIRTLTTGIRTAFKGILRLVIAHHDEERTVRIRGQWVRYNPAHWNVDMDCRVNVGLGGGSRERDMAVLQVVLGLQRELIASIGPDNPYVKPDQLFNTLEQITETAGFPSAEPYFTEPDAQEIAAKMQAVQSQPDPAQQVAQAKIALEKMKAEAAVQKEQAQMMADLKVEDARRESDLMIESLKAQIDLLKHREKTQLEYAKANIQAPPVSPVSVPEQIHG